MRLTLFVALALAGIALAGFGLILLDDRAGPPIVIEDPLADATIVVAVEGAVESPGVYPLPAEARAQDALAAAGGPTSDADLSAINLARRLRDEERLVVPSRSGAAGADATPANPPRVANAAGTAPLVDLNTASVVELDGLPGIGPVIAQRIVDYRAANGPFQAVEELVKVEGISPRMVEELRPLVTVGP